MMPLERAIFLSSSQLLTAILIAITTATKENQDNNPQYMIRNTKKHVEHLLIDAGICRTIFEFNDDVSTIE